MTFRMAAQILVIERTFVVRADLGEDLLFALGVEKTHLGFRFQCANIKRMTSTFVQKRHELLVDRIDRFAVLLDLSKRILL